MRRALLLLSALALLGACSDRGSSTRDTIDTSSPFRWKSFGDDGRVQTGSLEVPIDRTDPSKGSFDLFVARHLAEPEQRIGSLLVNPGGPGIPGSDFALAAEQIYSPALLARFDIVAWDPRGTGLTTPAIDCFDDYDHFFTGVDITPDTPEERQLPVDLAEELAKDCESKNADIMPFVGTNESARDIDAIRAALGEDTISYFGFSYGSELGATWATMFPDTVRAAVLDGAVDPGADLTDVSLQQNIGFEHAISTFLSTCSANPECAFHHDGNAEGAFDDLMLQLDDAPIATEDGRPDLTRGMALQATAQAMYTTPLWPVLEQALADAEQGDGAGMLHLFDDYYRRSPDGTYENSLEAFQVILCQDVADRPSVEEEDALAPRFQAAAPRFAPGTIGGYTCTFFPPTIDPQIAITGKGAGPILVMGTTGDPATPLDGTRAMARALEDGRLVVVHAEGHTGYAPGACSGDTVDRYLIDPVGAAPTDGTECR